jgi:RNA polymerase sigma-70 factor (ECF subfamily)
MTDMAGAASLGDLAGAIRARPEEVSVVTELKAGSEEAYAWLISQFHQPVYSLVYRILNDSADAADTTQEVFLKVFRGIHRFNGESSLKTWIYRIAVHEASNHRRWWFRHKSRELTMEPLDSGDSRDDHAPALKDTLVDVSDSPDESIAHEELRARVEQELQQVPEPYRTTVILRDIEELSYEEVADVMQTSLGTVKSRLMRGREALRKRLEPFIRQAGPERFGLQSMATAKAPSHSARATSRGQELEVTS